MKILIWNPYLSLGGGLRLLIKLTEAISCQADVKLVRLALPSGCINNPEMLNNKKVEILELNQFWLEKHQIILGIKGTIRIKSLLRRLLPQFLAQGKQKQFQNAVADCDLIYCPWPHRLTFPLTDKPVICTFQDATLLEFPEILGGQVSYLEWQLSKVWMEKSTRIVVSSNSTKEKLIKQFGKICQKADLIHHAILPETQQNLPLDCSKLLDNLPKKYVIFPANITTHKNHYNLLIAWSRFQRRKEFPLILLGNGIQDLNYSNPYFPEYWSAARLTGVIYRTNLILREDIYALGYVDDADVISLISQATALIMPTLAEGGGSFPVEEALTFGVPVLCSNIPVMQEHLSYRSAKIAWFDPDCPSSIVEALNTFFENYAEYKQSAIKGMTDPRPSWDDIASQYVKVFNEALN
ncbi:glycosyltransferase [Laspinema olomoucense]|uniref:Glycosyltransferase n=1 Tax=Laspinema olomoucense D3b TaxID=2953688 RepID=A0ABT2N3Y1_9CYAN|nr:MULTISPECIES: glycosyltransferase [unclassified Laspinema]MCT7977389.1 glycosyltransferase [Laspinema sp. D3b]MCT7986808.1 glycosyltransferase [Laspinema sp. D3a]